MFINLITHGCLNCKHGSGVYVNRFNRDRGLATTTGVQEVCALHHKKLCLVDLARSRRTVRACSLCEV